MKHSSQWNLTRESVLGSRTGRGDAGTRPAARLRHQPGSGDTAGQQDRARPDRLRHCRGRRYGERSARGLPQELSAAAASKLSRQDARRTPGSLVRIAPEESAAGAAGDRGAAHRLVDGRKHGTHGEDLGNHAAPSRISWRWKVIKRPPPRTRPGSTRIWCATISESPRTTISAATRSLEKLAKLKPVFDYIGSGYPDCGKFDAHDRWRLRGAARRPKPGRASATCRCWRT